VRANATVEGCEKHGPASGGGCMNNCVVDAVTCGKLFTEPADHQQRIVDT